MTHCCISSYDAGWRTRGYLPEGSRSSFPNSLPLIEKVWIGSKCNVEPTTLRSALKHQSRPSSYVSEVPGAVIRIRMFWSTLLRYEQLAQPR